MRCDIILNGFDKIIQKEVFMVPDVISDDKFTPVTIDDMELFRNILSSCDLYKNLEASEITFESVFCWGAFDNPKKCVLDEGIVIFYEHEFGNDNVFYPPLVYKTDDFVPVMMKIVTYCRKKGINVHLERMTRNMAEWAAARIDCRQCKVIPRRCDCEYLYNPQDLATLAGKKLKNKRNFVNGFIDRYDYVFVSYVESMREELLQLVKVWGKTHNELDAGGEYKAIVRALDNIKKLNLFCDVLKVDGKIIAFEIGFINQANVGVVMFEKANTDYRGSFQAVNNFFVKKHFTGCKYVNRQEDLGIPGLREAKMSYHPVAFSEKFIYTDRPDIIAAAEAEQEKFAAAE